MTTEMCPVCRQGVVPFGTGEVLGRRIDYQRCPSCGLVRTEEPEWLAEAYSNPIAALDVGLVQRCGELANWTEAIVRAHRPRGRFLDWAGGYGLLTRTLRDRGLDFWHHDSMTKNVHAIGREADPGSGFDLITAYEVVEHLWDPLPILEELVANAPIVLFTTLLLPEPAPAPGEWWYYAPESGQHVCLHTTRSLEAMATALGGELVTNGVDRHAFVMGGSLGRFARMLIRTPRLNSLTRPLLKRLRPTPSLIPVDLEAATRH